MPLMQILYGEDVTRKQALEVDATIRGNIAAEAQASGEQEAALIPDEYKGFRSTVRTSGIANNFVTVTIQLLPRTEEQRKRYEDATKRTLDAMHVKGYVQVLCVPEECWIGWD